MAEMAEIRDATKPHEILLVADALTGQDAVNLAKNFNERVGVTGIVLTRVDGDGRGGAALSMRAVTGKPIKLLGVGEKMDALEDFHPQRLADRILGMGDIVSLVEKAAQNIDAAQAAKMAERMRKGVFDLNDLSEQLAQIEKIGGMGGIMSMLPGMAKIKDQIASAHLDNKVIGRQRAIISSMTPKERRNPDLLKASRKKRIAAGSGVNVEAVNRLLKQHRQMADMMKSMGGAGKARADGAAWPDVRHGRRHAAADAGAIGSVSKADGRRACPAPKAAAFPKRRRPARSTCRRQCRACRALARRNCRASVDSAADSIRSEERRSDRRTTRAAPPRPTKRGEGWGEGRRDWESPAANAHRPKVAQPLIPRRMRSIRPHPQANAQHSSSSPGECAAFVLIPRRMRSIRPRPFGPPSPRMRGEGSSRIY